MIKCNWSKCNCLQLWSSALVVVAQCSIVMLLLCHAEYKNDITLKGEIRMSSRCLGSFIGLTLGQKCCRWPEYCSKEERAAVLQRNLNRFPNFDLNRLEFLGRKVRIAQFISKSVRHRKWAKVLALFDIEGALHIRKAKKWNSNQSNTQ